MLDRKKLSSRIHCIDATCSTRPINRAEVSYMTYGSVWRCICEWSEYVYCTMRTRRKTVLSFVGTHSTRELGDGPRLSLRKCWTCREKGCAVESCRWYYMCAHINVHGNLYNPGRSNGSLKREKEEGRTSNTRAFGKGARMIAYYAPTDPYGRALSARIALSQ